MTRLAIIEKDKCFPKQCGEWCIKKCPVNKMGKECIIISSEKKAQIAEELCIGCGICVRCPFSAIHIVNLPEKLKQEPIHRFDNESRVEWRTKGYYVILREIGTGKKVKFEVEYGDCSSSPPEDWCWWDCVLFEEG